MKNKFLKKVITILFLSINIISCSDMLNEYFGFESVKNCTVRIYRAYRNYYYDYTIYQDRSEIKIYLDKTEFVMSSDEYVIPDYSNSDDDYFFTKWKVEISKSLFEKEEEYHLPGETITIKGNVTLYPCIEYDKTVRFNFYTDREAYYTGGGHFEQSYKYSERKSIPSYEEISGFCYSWYGYEFLGWIDASKPDEIISEIPFDDRDNVYLYGKWKIKPAITYYLEDGNNTQDFSNPADFSENSRIVLKDPNVDGYHFDGWYKENDYFKNERVYELWAPASPSEDAYPSTGYSNQNITLIARLDPYITYELNGGDFNSWDYVPHWISSGGVTPPAPLREGYVFDGWYSDSEYTYREYDLYKNNHSKPLTLYAKWNVNTQIVYELNGGTNSEFNQNYFTDDSLYLNAPSREGYTFDGWYYDSVFNLFVEDSYIYKSQYENQEYLYLYAKWRPITQIVYELNGGIDSGMNPASFTEDSFYLNAPSREGYTFEGWYYDSDFNSPVGDYPIYKSNYENQEYLYFYAKWNVNTQIVYELNGGIDSGMNPASFTGDSFYLYEPSRGGYTFEGWYYDSDFNSPVEDSYIYKSQYENQEYLYFYAKWKIIPATGVVVMSDGSFAAADEVSISADYYPVGVICSAGDYDSDGYMIGLHNSGLNFYKWAEKDTYGDKNYFSSIAGGMYGNGDTDGSDNLDVICSEDPNGTMDLENNYPAFAYVKNYGEEFAGTQFQSGWYMPTLYEMNYYISPYLEILNTALNSLSMYFPDSVISTTGWYWSSTQTTAPGTAGLYDFGLGGSREDFSKFNKAYVCCIRRINVLR